jgi:hypothetical protein
MSDKIDDWWQARLAYTDAELYRLIVARVLLDGDARDKAEFDDQVRRLGDIEASDKLIAFRTQRPGCIANDYGDKFECACGVAWDADNPNPPACQQDVLR